MDRGGTRSMLNTNFEKEELEGNTNNNALICAPPFSTSLTVFFCVYIIVDITCNFSSHTTTFLCATVIWENK